MRFACYKDRKAIVLKAVCTASDETALAGFEQCNLARRHLSVAPGGGGTARGQVQLIGQCHAVRQPICTLHHKGPQGTAFEHSSNEAAKSSSWSTAARLQHSRCRPARGDVL